jgi:hypothetical protein
MSRPRRIFQVGLFGLAAAVGYTVLVWRPVVMTALGVEPPAGWWFVDTYALLAASDMAALGLDPYVPNPLDLLGVPHWYSDWWFLIGHLGLTRFDVYWLGAGVVGLFLASAILVLRPRNGSEALVAWLALCSPPVILGVNRANADLLIFSIMALLGLALASPRRWVWWQGPWLVALAAGLKFYPIVVGLILVLVARPRREVWASLAVMTLLVLAVAMSVSDAIARALPLLMSPEGFFSFGSSALFTLAGLSPPAAKWAAWMAGALVALGWLRRTPVPPAALPGHEKMAFGLGALIVVGCFFAGVSYSYRLVFLLLMLPLLWTWSRAAGVHSGAGPARLVLGLTLPLVWIDGLACATINLGWAQRMGIPMHTVELAAGWLTHTVSWVWVGGTCGLLLALYRPAIASLFGGSPPNVEVSPCV